VVSFTFDGGKKTPGDKKKTKNRREEISVKAPNREARNKFTDGDKKNLNECGGENVGAESINRAPTVGFCEEDCQF
jgi:hypothetical protein